MNARITCEITTTMDWRGFTILGNVLPPRDPDDEDDEEEEEDEEEGADEPAVVREPDDG